MISHRLTHLIYDSEYIIKIQTCVYVGKFHVETYKNDHADPNAQIHMRVHAYIVFLMGAVLGMW